MKYAFGFWMAGVLGFAAWAIGRDWGKVTTPRKDCVSLVDGKWVHDEEACAKGYKNR